METPPQGFDAASAALVGQFRGGECVRDLVTAPKLRTSVTLSVANITVTEEQLLAQARARYGDNAQIVDFQQTSSFEYHPSPEHEYGYRNPGLPGIYLRFCECAGVRNNS